MRCSFIYFFYFFLFKQKTAYEMRISDWSSDVCSSDLPISSTSVNWWPSTVIPRPMARCRRRHGSAGSLSCGPKIHRASPWGRPVERTVKLACRRRLPRGWDRKSVVEGKEVAGRVTRGGRRNNEKTKQVSEHYQ